jgi:hypothetical protein
MCGRVVHPSEVMRHRAKEVLDHGRDEYHMQSMRDMIIRLENEINDRVQMRAQAKKELRRLERTQTVRKSA